MAVKDPVASREDVLRAVTLAEELVTRSRRVFGPAHPETLLAKTWLVDLREKLHQGPGGL